MTIYQLETDKPVSIKLTEAAEIMGINAQALRIALQRNQFDFGRAIKKKRWTYYINTERFLRYLKGM